MSLRTIVTTLLFITQSLWVQSASLFLRGTSLDLELPLQTIHMNYAKEKISEKPTADSTKETLIEQKETAVEEEMILNIEVSFYPILLYIYIYIYRILPIKLF